MTRVLVTLGVMLVAVGLAWPWLVKLGLFRLPGDIVIERENFRIYFPITSMILISLAISLVLWLIKK